MEASSSFVNKFDANEIKGTLIFIFFLFGILFYSKSLPHRSALRNAEKFKGGELQVPKNLKKIDFFFF